MSYKNNIKHRNSSFQGLRSFKDPLPTSVKKIINNKKLEEISLIAYVVNLDIFSIISIFC